MIDFEDQNFATVIGYALLVINFGGAVATLMIQISLGLLMIAAGATAIGYAVLVVNMGGVVVTSIIQLCGGVVMMAAGIADTGSWVDVIPQWVWDTATIGTVFVGALIQGLVYAVAINGAISMCQARRSCPRVAALHASSEQDK
jgi:hypothetical protein